MFRTNLFRFVSPLLLTSRKISALDYQSRTPHILSKLPRLQAATFVYIPTVKLSDPQQRFQVTVLHPHPDAGQEGKKILEIDFIFAEDDGVQDVCWRFQFVDGESVKDRLEAYATAFGKHGSGDEDFNEYVRAFQSKVYGMLYSHKFGKEGHVEDDE